MSPKQELNHLLLLQVRWTKAMETGSDFWEQHWHAFDTAREEFVKKYLTK